MIPILILCAFLFIFCATINISESDNSWLTTWTIIGISVACLGVGMVVGDYLANSYRTEESCQSVDNSTVSITDSYDLVRIQITERFRKYKQDYINIYGICPPKDSALLWLCEQREYYRFPIRNIQLDVETGEVFVLPL